ncbi:hypothetical protein L6R50_27545 [Myxococcota bacterium]|nr:hypothetical protein [Myxococcota bacterium]
MIPSPAPAPPTTWPVPLEPDLGRVDGGFVHRWTATGAELWSGPHLGIYPGIWFAARALAAVATLSGGVPERWYVPRIWFRGSVRSGERLEMTLRRRGGGWWVEHLAEGGRGPARAVIEVADRPPEGGLPSQPPPEDADLATSLRAEPPEAYEQREVVVGSAEVRLPWIRGELVSPGAAAWMLRGFPAAPGLWMVEGLGQLSFLALNRAAGRRAGGPEGPARYVAGRLAPVWLDNRTATGAGARFPAWVHLARGGDASGIGRAAATEGGNVVAAMDCLYARVDASGGGPGLALLGR